MNSVKQESENQSKKSQITGMAVQDINTKQLPSGMYIGAIILLATGIFGYLKFFKLKN